MYNHIQWVVQRNLTSREDFERLENACLTIGVPFIPLEIIPFTPALPAFDKSKDTIIYGSTTFNALAAEDVQLKKGLFFDPVTFSIENYKQRWGKYMLNGDARIMTFRELMTSDAYSPDQLLFIRPDDDSKSFAGEVKAFEEIAAWYGQLSQVSNMHLTPDTVIVVGVPYSIAAEWRLWIVAGKVVAASKYREYFKLRKEAGCPEAVKLFAEQRCKEYVPHEVFVMDICLCGDEYYIVECGSMNGAGFYKADVQAIVHAVTAYFGSKSSNLPVPVE